MRLLLVFPFRAGPTYAPLGVAALAAAARASAPATEVEILDLNLRAFRRALESDAEGDAAVRFFRGPGADLGIPAAYDRHTSTIARAARRIEQVGEEARIAGEVAEILARAPDLVGISAVFPAQVEPAVSLGRRLAAAGLRVVLGGAALGALDLAALRAAAPFFEAIVVGEGEEPLAALLRGGSASGRHREGEDWPVPDFSLLTLDEYLVSTPVLPILASRGCRWRRCRYCVHNVTFGRYRRKAAAAVVDEIEEHGRRHGARLFYFADEYVDGDRLLLLSREILRRGLDVGFHVMGRPDETMTREVLQTAFSAGLRWISWGVETASARLLDLCRKGCQPETAEALLAESSAAGISNLAMLILGLPTSTGADLEATLDFIDRTSPYIDAVSAGVFVLYENSTFARRAADLGLVVTGPETALTAGGVVVPSTRLRYRVRSAQGFDLAPPGAEELERFTRHCATLRGSRLLERVTCEHYLTLAAERSRPAHRAG